MTVKRTIFMKAIILLLCFITLGSVAQSYRFKVIYVKSDVDSLPKYSINTRDVYKFISDNFFVNSLMRNEVGNTSQCILVDFIIDSIGNVSDIHFGDVSDIHFRDYTDLNCLQSRSRYVEQEISRIFDKMPSWQPGYKNGKPITIRVYMPIHYMMYNNMFMITNKEEELVVKNNKKNLPIKLTIIGVVAIFFFTLFLK